MRVSYDCGSLLQSCGVLYSRTARTVPVAKRELAACEKALQDLRKTLRVYFAVSFEWYLLDKYYPEVVFAELEAHEASGRHLGQETHP
jgi:hypothetical protein